MSRVVIETDEMATLEFEVLHTGVTMVHLTVHNNVWTKAKYREWKDIWKEVLEDARTQGIKELFTLVPSEDTKVNKFQTMFGFEPLIVFKAHILYRQEICYGGC